MSRLIVVVAMGLVALVASAAGCKVSSGDADVNHDGAITRQEAASSVALERGFDAADENGNGLIEPVEYAHLQGANNMSGK